VTGVARSLSAVTFSVWRWDVRCPAVLPYFRTQFQTDEEICVHSFTCDVTIKKKHDEVPKPGVGS
jgi:hypothetical protein